MRIERVVAHAFGALRGETLELAQGMTVICGPNEAGKTSWHAAIRAAVCGVRRSRGRATASPSARSTTSTSPSISPSTRTTWWRPFASGWRT